MFSHVPPRVAAVVTATAAVATLGVTSVHPGAAGSASADGSDSAMARAHHGADLGLVSSAPMVGLARRSGTVHGNGRTYVANGTRFRPAGVADVPPRIRARSWIVVDASSGVILGTHRAKRRLPQASTIKLLSALTAIDTVPKRPRHRVTRWEKKQTCTCVGLVRGARYDRADLLAGMLLPSGNDAAEALAGSHPHGRWAFYAAMNRKADEIGAFDTAAANASGLTAPDSYSTARDLVIMLDAALGERLVAPYLSMPSARISTRAGRGVRRVWHGTDYVEKFARSAGKSGYTTPAKNTLVVRTVVRGERLYVATMGSPGGYSTDGARALAKWAAQNRSHLRPVGVVRRVRR